MPSSDGVRPGSERGQTRVRTGSDQGLTLVMGRLNPLSRGVAGFARIAHRLPLLTSQSAPRKTTMFDTGVKQRRGWRRALMWLAEHIEVR
jgi:hypothetical protein